MEGRADEKCPKEEELEGSAKERSRPGSLAAAGDRSKRDEWSEGAVACLLDAYESKWVLRNRAKLKGHDWEDVARQVSSRANSTTTKSSKTPTQCKNKVESMKKRYRSESACGSGSRWPLFPRLDGLVRCRAPPPPPSTTTTTTTTLMLINDQDAPEAAASPPPPPPPPLAAGTQMSSQSLDPSATATAAAAAAAAQEEVREADKAQPNEIAKEVEHELQEIGKDQLKHDTSSSEDSYREKQTKKRKKKKKKQSTEGGGWEVLESCKWLAEVVLRIEQSRMDAMREVERIRAQAEAKKGEMDLKRTEIIANTQLQIAKLLTRKAKNNDSAESSRIRRD